MASPATPRAAERVRNRRGEGARLRDVLIEAATELLAEAGDAERVSIRAVTARAGVSPMAFYLHFEDKEALVRTIVAQGFVELRRFVAEAERAHAGDPVAQLRMACRAYLDFALRRAGVYRVLFQVRRYPPDHVNDVPFETRQAGEGDDAFADLVRGVGRVLAADVDPWPVAVDVWALLHGLATLRPALPGFPWPDTDALLDRALQGLVLGAGR